LKPLFYSLSLIFTARTSGIHPATGTRLAERQNSGFVIDHEQHGATTVNQRHTTQQAAPEALKRPLPTEKSLKNTRTWKPGLPFASLQAEVGASIAATTCISPISKQ
jgi:hypothetical protein